GGASTDPPESTDGGSTAQPLTLDNCGTQVTLPEVPERVVTVKSAATELVLALDRADLLVGTAFADGPVPAQWAQADVPVLSEKLPSSEVVLAAEPDLVIAGWESNFSAEGVGTRDE